MPSEAELRALVASGTIGMCSWTIGRDRAGITAADDAFLALVGHTRASFEEQPGLDWRTLTPTDWTATFDEGLSMLLEIGSHGPRELEILSRSGERVPVMVTSALVDAASGQAVSLCIDLTVPAHRRVDAERASLAKSRFLGVMSHELRTPLNTIIGQVALITEGAYGVVTETQSAALGRLRAAGIALRALVEEVLLFSRLESGAEQFAVEEVSLADALALAAESIESRVAAKALTFSAQPPPASVLVHADPEKLQLVLTALLSNAIKFTPTGGHITLDTAARAGTSDYVFVRVSDTGSGVARERYNLIFEPFTQLDEGRTRTVTGLGLGLTISRDLARGMGGDLRVRSTDGGGSTFTLSLRRAPMRAGEAVEEW